MQLTLNKLPWYSQVAVFAAIGAVGAGAFWYFYDSPAREKLRAREQQLATVKSEVARGLAIERRLPEFKREIADLEARLDSLRAVLPEQKDVGELLRRLQTLATQSNLAIRAFKPLAIAQQQMHAEWPIQLELDGTYHDLGIFFDKVSKVPRIINISAIGLKSKDRGRPGASAAPEGGATVEAACLATTFVLSEPPAEANPKAGKAGPQRPAAAARR